MELVEIPLGQRSAWLQPLTELWEASVRASHHFLPEEEVETLAPFVGNVLDEIAILVLAVENGQALGFLGVQGEKAEMLFLHPLACGKGLGKALLLHGVQQFGVRFVDVNEQNPKALGFYEHLGFRVFARSPLDSEGRPYPLLHCCLENVHNF